MRASRHLIARIAQGILAAALISAVLWVAGPANVLRLIRRTRPAALGGAAAVYLAVVMLRAVRLEMLLPSGRLGFGRSLQVSAVAQAAALFVPARLGELVLPALLRRTAGLELSGGIGVLLVARSLDLAALGTWAAGAVAWRWGARRPLLLIAGLALVVPLLLLPVTTALADRAATRWLAPRGVVGRRWTRRLRRLRRSLVELAARPGRLAASVVVSLALWGGIWITVGLLLGGLGYRWPFGAVLVGAAAASVATLLPVNLVANLGTLEAGWTAGFAAVGIPVKTAAASGVAVHLWSLTVSAVIGLAGVLSLWVAGPPRWRAPDLRRQ